MNRPAYRADIDGLRGVAISVVVGFHAFPGRVPGGFIGVDVFFVISGFLISRLILASLAADNFGLAEFYGRRIRRIFPALGLVLLTIGAVGWFALLADEFARLGTHLAAGATFVSNFRLWHEAGYFDTASDTKPFLHLWSVSVEEQFYLVWPILLVAAWRTRMNVRAVALGIALATFALGIYLLPHSPEAAFYSPLCRVWELMIGAWLAASPVALTRPSTRTWASCAGIAMIAVPVLLLDKHTPFPGWWATLPVCGTALAIAAGPETWINRSLLSSRLAVWIGLISYPLYLWHWPLLSLARIVESGEPTVAIRLTTVALSGGLAIATYLLIERKCQARPVTLVRSLVLATPIVVAALAGWAIVRHDGYPARIADNAHLQLQLEEQHFSSVGCSNLNLVHFDAAHCTSVGRTGRTALIIGDSHARHSFFVLQDYLTQQGLSVIALSKGGCPFLLGVTTNNVDDCEASNQEVLGLIERRSDIVQIILTAEYTSYTGARLVPVANSPLAGASGPLLEQALTLTLERLKRWPVVFMHQIPPLTFDPRACVPRPVRLSAHARGCSSSRADVDREVAAYRAVADRVLSKFPDVKPFDATGALCDTAICSATNYGDVLYFNPTHLNAIGATFVARRAHFEQLSSR